MCIVPQDQDDCPMIFNRAISGKKVSRVISRKKSLAGSFQEKKSLAGPFQEKKSLAGPFQEKKSLAGPFQEKYFTTVCLY